MWGIDLESGEEYISQHTGCAHFIDIALLSGIDIHMPEGCGLERDIGPYPDRYETHLALTLEKKYNWLSSAITSMEGDFEVAKAQTYRHEGYINALREGNAEQEMIDKATEGLNASNAQVGQIAANLNHLKGEKSASQFYRRMYVWGMTDPDE